jgi:putative tricarboxylic transport membrane protein
MKLADLWSGIFWLLISLWVIFEAFQFGIGKWKTPGPGFLPFWSGAFLACFALVQIFSTLSRKAAFPEKHPWEKIRWGKWGLTLLVLLGYALLLEPLGFILCTLIFMIVLLAAVEPQRWPVVLLISIVTTIASYLIFHLWLKSQLPVGILGI